MLTTGVADGTNASDNAIFLTATYKLAQNLLARLSYVHQSGDFWTGANTVSNNTGNLGSNSTTINLYALY